MPDAETERFVREHNALSKKLDALGGGIERLIEVKDAEGNVLGWRDPDMKFPHIPLAEYMVIDMLQEGGLHKEAKFLLQKIPQEYASHLEECKNCIDIYNKHKEGTS